MPEVSIIIPTYNRCNFVKDTIKSILQQSFTDFETLVIDDGSTDSTASVTQNIPDDRVKYFYKENEGASSARNFGLNKAKGEYIAFLDSDDLWTKDYLETIMRHLKEQPTYGAAYTQIKLLCSNGKTKPFGYLDRNKSGRITSDFFGGGLCILPSSSIFKKSVWNDFWWDEILTNGYDDFDAFLRISVKTEFLFVPDIYALRRESSGSVSNLASRTISPSGPLVMERFYYQLGGDKYIPKFTAMRKISHRYRSLAKQHRKAGNKRASILLTKRAVYYCPWDLRLYLDLLRAVFLNKDNMPGWQMPKPLPLHITVICDTKNNECKSSMKQ